jgi:adenylate cyclase
MVDAIFGQGGTLVSYQGDGILAVFGAPIPTEDHADPSLAAAREMLEVRLPRFNRWLREHGSGQRLRNGHRAEQRVLHVGERRLAAAARVHGLRDTVNTASPLEAMTKTTGRSILVAKSTRDALLNPPHDLSFAGELDVRGRESKIRTWTLRCSST